MVERTTGPKVVEWGYLQRRTSRGRCVTTVSFGVNDAGPFVGERQVRPPRGRAMGSAPPKRLASSSPDSPTPMGVWQP